MRGEGVMGHEINLAVLPLVTHVHMAYSEGNYAHNVIHCSLHYCIPRWKQTVYNPMPAEIICSNAMVIIVLNTVEKAITSDDLNSDMGFSFLCFSSHWHDWLTILDSYF